MLFLGLPGNLLALVRAQTLWLHLRERREHVGARKNWGAKEPWQGQACPSAGPGSPGHTPLTLLDFTSLIWKTEVMSPALFQLRRPCR